MEGPQVVRSLPRPCGFSDFHPAAAPVYPSPEAASTMWSKKLLPASQSVTMFVNRIEFASIPFPDRFPPPSLRAATTFLFDLSTGLLSGGTPGTRRQTVRNLDSLLYRFLYLSMLPSLSSYRRPIRAASSASRRSASASRMPSSPSLLAS